VVCLSNSGHIENKIFNVTEVSNHELITAVNIFQQRLVGQKIREIPEIVYLLKPILMNQIQHYEYVIRHFVEIFLHFTVPYQVTSGMHYLFKDNKLDLPEIKSIVNLISQGIPWQHFLSDGFQIKIGKEINQQCKDLAIIVNNLQWNGGQKHGKIAVIGATRLEYQKITHILNLLVNTLNKLNLTEKEGEN
jgi:transcriptional regulator of heat shock response